MSDSSKPTSAPSHERKSRPSKPVTSKPSPTSSSSTASSSKDEKSASPSSSSSSSASSPSSLDDAYPSTNIGSYMSRQFDFEVESKKMPGFICGACYSVKTFQVGEDLRCRKCGYRIMYKERLRRRQHHHTPSLPQAPLHHILPLTLSLPLCLPHSQPWCTPLSDRTAHPARPQSSSV